MNFHAPLMERTQGNDSSAIVAITIGPSEANPAILCISTEAGNLYFKAFPDFIKWEKHRNPSVLQQIASEQLQVVKGTILQAQNWTTETAGVIAENAKSIADDAMKKVLLISLITLILLFLIYRTNIRFEVAAL
jgi:hypothetical protein